MRVVILEYLFELLCAHCQHLREPKPVLSLSSLEEPARILPVDHSPATGDAYFFDFHAARVRDSLTGESLRTLESKKNKWFRVVSVVPFFNVVGPFNLLKRAKMDEKSQFYFRPDTEDSMRVCLNSETRWLHAIPSFRQLQNILLLILTGQASFVANVTPDVFLGRTQIEP
jgi:hypothetical protein